jgi:hypothetical protein
MSPKKPEIEDPCACGAPSEYGAHGIRDNKVYDEYFCESCYNKERKGKDSIVHRGPTPENQQVRVVDKVLEVANSGNSG